MTGIQQTELPGQMQTPATSAVVECPNHVSPRGAIKTSDRLIKKAAKGGGIALAGNVVDKGLRFPLELLLARVLGAGGYGAYSLGYGLTIIASELSMLGLSSGVVRFGALHRGAGDLRRVKGTVKAALIISTVSSIVAGGLLFVFAGSVSEVFDMPNLANVLRVFSLAFPFYVITCMAGHTAGAFQAIKHQTAVTNLCRPLANVLIVLLLFVLGFGLIGAVCGFLVSSMISACFGLYLVKRVFPDIVSQVRPAYEIGKLLRFSVPVLFVAFSYVLLAQTDRIMLGYFRASRDLGIYSAAAILSQQAGMVTYSFSYIFCPVISDLYNRGEMRDLDRLYKTVTRWIVSMNLLILLLLMIFSRQILAIFGSEFTTGWLVLVILAAVHLIGYGIGGALVGHVLRMSGKQDIELINATAMLVTNIVLNFWLIPRYGILGAAIATGISYAVINLARIVEVFALLRIHPYDSHYHKPFIAGLAVLLLSVSLSAWSITGLYWIFTTVVLAVVYVGVLYFLGVGYEDKMIWATIKSRVGQARGRSR